MDFNGADSPSPLSPSPSHPPSFPSFRGRPPPDQGGAHACQVQSLFRGGIAGKLEEHRAQAGHYKIDTCASSYITWHFTCVTVHNASAWKLLNATVARSYLDYLYAASLRKVRAFNTTHVLLALRRATTRAFRSSPPPRAFSSPRERAHFRNASARCKLIVVIPSVSPRRRDATIGDIEICARDLIFLLCDRRRNSTCSTFIAEKMVHK